MDMSYVVTKLHSIRNVHSERTTWLWSDWCCKDVKLQLHGLSTQDERSNCMVTEPSQTFRMSYAITKPLF